MGKRSSKKAATQERVWTLASESAVRSSVCPQRPAGAARERSLFRVARLRMSSSPAVRLAGGLVTTAPHRASSPLKAAPSPV